MLMLLKVLYLIFSVLIMFSPHLSLHYFKLNSNVYESVYRQESEKCW